MANQSTSSKITMSEDNIINTPNIAIEPTQSMGTFMFTNMKKHKNNIAQIDAKTGQKDTFEKLLQRSTRTALHMLDRKISRGDVITLCTRNHLNAVVPYIATQFIGAVIGSIDPSFSPQEMNHLLNTVRPKIIFTLPESVPILEKVLQEISLDAEIIVFGQSNKHTEFSAFLKPHAREEGFEPVKIENLQDTAVVHFSSGTTGLPKGICLSHYAFVGQMINVRLTDYPNEAYMKKAVKYICFPMTHLGYTSLYWLSAGAMLLGSIGDGHCRLVCETFDGKEAWNYIQKYKPCFVMMTPVQVIEMLANRRKEVDVQCVLNFSVIGSSISKEYLLQIQEAFPNAYLGAGYGQTEVCGPLTMLVPNDKHHAELRANPEKIETVGVPVRGTSYKVVDTATGKTVGFKQRGELRIKSKFIMNGYYNRDSSDTFDLDGWLKTGDIVYYDEDFCFYVIDRIKEAFKYQGWFIAPALLENELLNHPAVKIAVVVGIPRDDGHHPMGLVVLNDGFRVSEEEIEKFIEERVPERQRLRAGVKFIDSVPLTVTGKVMRRELKQMVLEGKI
ncbi:uncharacterized protein LOC135142984 [Zophobas morio]|uniref:uncharacterized protein LOC135142984 n=1 Tax=Zophobas morio TaxID=2755281 RepID=UPI0030832E22